MAAAVLTAFSLSSACDMWVLTLKLPTDSYLADGSSCIDSFFSKLCLGHMSAHTLLPTDSYGTWLIAAAVLTAFSLSSACDIWVPTPPISCFRLSRDVSWKVKSFIYFLIAFNFFRRPLVQPETRRFNCDPDPIFSKKFESGSSIRIPRLRMRNCCERPVKLSSIIISFITI